jgi:NAD(P)-dependent dehydrogenase (short-subunit alcohol dehydrogenase family)
MSLAGKVAIVTGASRGIGAAIAAALARDGADLALVARGADALTAVAAAVAAASGRRVVTYPCDLRLTADIERLVTGILEDFGRLDILVNNAGASKHGNLLQATDEDWADAFDTKLFAYVRMSRLCWPHLKASRGRLVNIVGILGQTPNVDAVIGSALAAAAQSFTKAIAEQGRLDGVTVNAVNPGLILTARFRERVTALSQAEGIGEAAAEARMLERLKIDRFGEATEVAELVAFLMSEQARYFHGASINLDGGMTKGV